MVLNADQELALQELLCQVCALRPRSRTCITSSGVGDSAGSEVAERAVQAIKEMVRVRKLAL